MVLIIINSCFVKDCVIIINLSIDIGELCVYCWWSSNGMWTNRHLLVRLVNYLSNLVVRISNICDQHYYLARNLKKDVWLKRCIKHSPVFSWAFLRISFYNLWLYHFCAPASSKNSIPFFRAHEQWGLSDPPDFVTFSKKMLIGGFYFRDGFLPKQVKHLLFTVWMFIPDNDI